MKPISLRLWLVLLLTMGAMGASIGARPMRGQAMAPPGGQLMPKAVASAGLVDATTLGTSPSLYLNTWRFHMGDSPGVDLSGTPAWADPAFDDSQWPVVTTDKRLAEQGFKSGFPGFCWYRLAIRVPANANLSLYLSDILSSYEVFVDGHKAGQFGGLPPHEVRYSTTARAYALPSYAESRTIVIAVRDWAHPIASPPGLEPMSSYIGHSADIANMRSVYVLEEFRDMVESVVLDGVFFVMGVLLLGVYINQRTQREWFWLGLAFVADGVAETMRGLNLLAMAPYVYALTIGNAASFLNLALTFQFILVFVAVRPNRWTRVFQGLLLAAALISLSNFTGNIPLAITTLAAGEVLAVYALLALGLLAFWWVRGNREAGILLIPLGFLYGSNIGQVLGQAAFALHWQDGRIPHSALPVWKLPGGAFDSDFLFQMVYVLAILLILLRRSALSSRESEQLAAEIAAARTVQQVLIPDFLPPVAGLLVESAYLPAQQVGGDFFQVLPIPGGGDAFIVVGDVSGKGLKAAMTVSLLVGTLRTLAEYVVSPAEMLAGLNRRLHGRDAGFATCLVLKITPEGEVTIANAGHPNPYLDGVEVSTESDLPLGLTLDVTYAETRLHIDATQSFTLVTDGVVEATAPATRELFGFERTQAISKQAAHAIAEAARIFGHGAPQADDITVLTITRTSRLEALPV